MKTRNWLVSFISLILPSVLVNQIVALTLNLRAWFFSLFQRVRTNQTALAASAASGAAIMIDGPGGAEQFRFENLIESDRATVGYNCPPHVCPLTLPGISKSLGVEDVLVKVQYFSVNFADVAIRWGLYESANQKVGYPICPGFDFVGVVEKAGSSSGFSTGDSVFGFTLFGAYTTRLLVPASQVRCIPQLKSAELLKSPTSRTPRASETQSSGHSSLSKVSIAGFPAVAATALHAIALACAYPNKIVTRNKAALVHSAAGGVGSMLVQMCKLRGFSPVIAIVGAIDKVEVCKSLGADVVIAKKAFKGNSWWHEVRKHAPDGCAAIFDANGVETLHDSYANLDRCGRLVLYGFHTNMPASTSYLAPWHWLSMIFKMAKMPAFDPMDLVLNSKTVAGFNLSFFADERELIAVYMKQLVDWLAEGQIKPAATKVFQMHEIAEAHALIQSGRSTGKIVMQCPQ